jgi:solute carrier family 50 protein (sugar transporter)
MVSHNLKSQISIPPKTKQPIPTIRQIAITKSVGSLPLLPYSSMIANCFLWTTYGLLKNERRIWGTNGTGLLCAIYYCWNFIRYAPPTSPSLPGSVRYHVQANLLLMVMTGLWVSVLSSGDHRDHDHADPAEWIGTIGVVFCVAMFGAPLAVVRTVLQTKSAHSIPLPFTVATVINCFLWSVAGILEYHDAYIYIPNLLGLACGLAQVVLKVLYSSKHGNGNHSSSSLVGMTAEDMVELIE